MAAAATSGPPAARDGPQGAVGPQTRAAQRAGVPQQPRPGESPRQRASPRPPDSPLPRGPPHPLFRSRSSQQLSTRRSSDPGGPGLGPRQSEIEAASPRGVPSPAPASLLRTGSMDLRRTLPAAAAPVPTHVLQAVLVWRPTVAALKCTIAGVMWSNMCCSRGTSNKFQRVQRVAL